MKAKKWTILLLAAIITVTGAFAGLMYILDPLVQFGTESFPLTSYEYSEMYSNPGIAKNYEYDAVMVGTSMIENTDVDICNKLFGCNMVRLPYSGGTTYNMKTILDVCFRHNSDIKTVYWELDEFQLTNSATEPRYPLPDYLYTDKAADKISYLLNLDIFYHYGVKDIIGTLKGEYQQAARKGSQLGGNFGKEAMLTTYSRPAISENITDFETSGMKAKTQANLNNIIPLIEANPETEFVFFFAPFSVLYWDNEIRQGRFDALMDGVIYSIDALLDHENVSVYYYQGEQNIITNLDNYKDYSHYCPDINNLLTEYISEGRNKVSKDNCSDMVNSFRSFIKNYDFDVIFE